MDNGNAGYCERAYATLCSALAANNWHFEKDDQAKSVRFTMQGKDLQMQMRVKVDEKRQVLMLLSELPFCIPQEKRMEAAIAVSHVNFKLIDGSFDYDVKRGGIVFRMTNSFRESDTSEEMMMYLVNCAAGTVDVFNDALYALGMGYISLPQFLAEN